MPGVHPSPPPAGRADPAGQGFRRFWAEYPKKIDQVGAWEAWEDLNPPPELAGQILASLAKWKASPRWQEEGQRYVPLAVKWLRRGDWKPEATPAPPPKPAKFDAVEHMRKLREELS